ncbi:MAG: hypothetical protein IJ228_07735 [Succinivibrio sp.]|nr:hypothetical protein [Succinivibrio sp.]
MSNVWLDKIEEEKASAESRGVKRGETNILLRIDLLRNKMKKVGKSLDEYEDIFSDRAKLDDLFLEYGVDEVTTVSA